MDPYATLASIQAESQLISNSKGVNSHKFEDSRFVWAFKENIWIIFNLDILRIKLIKTLKVFELLKHYWVEFRHFIQKMIAPNDWGFVPLNQFETIKSDDLVKCYNSVITYDFLLSYFQIFSNLKNKFKKELNILKQQKFCLVIVPLILFNFDYFL